MSALSSGINALVGDSERFLMLELAKDAKSQGRGY